MRAHVFNQDSGKSGRRWRLVAIVGVLVALLGAGAGAMALPGVISGGPPTAVPQPGSQDSPTALVVGSEDGLPTPVANWQPDETPIPPTAIATGVVGTPPPTASPSPTPSPSGDDVTSVLLMGYGGPGHPGSYLTDTIILAVLNRTRQTIVLFSLPRDIWVSLPLGQGQLYWSKLNTAYSYGTLDVFPNRPARYRGASGGGNLAKDVVGKILDYPIQSYAALDFATFRQAIDEVGGIDVDVAQSFTSGSTRFEAGEQHLDGTKALEFARAREDLNNPSEESDFARSRRQRQIVSAFLARLRSPSGLLHLVPLIGLARSGVNTDYQLPSVGALASLVGDSGKYRIVEGALTSSDYLRSASGPNGTYILLPRAGASQWAEVQAYFRSLLAK